MGNESYMQVSREELEEIIDTRVGKCIRNELRDFFDPEKNPIMIDPRHHYDHHHALDEGCLNPEIRKNRDKDHEVMGEFRGAMDGVKRKGLVGFILVVSAMFILGVIVMFPPAQKIIHFFSEMTSGGK